MCRKSYIEFWTPTDIKTSSLEDLTKRRLLREQDNPFAKLRRVEFFECHITNPPKIIYAKKPLCKSPTQGGRQGSIRAYCPGDDCCQIRIAHFAGEFDEAMRLLDAARQQQVREVVEFERRAELKLREWRVVWTEHLFCPQHKQADGMICALIAAGVMERPVELWPDRRMGVDPRAVRVG